MLKTAPFVVFIALAVAAIWAATQGVRSLAISENGLQAAGQRLVELAFLALLIERAVEVYLINIYEEKKLRATRDIRKFERKAEMLQKALDQESERPLPTAGTPAAEAAQTDRNAAIQDLRAKLVEAKSATFEAEQAATDDLEALRISKTSSAQTAGIVLGGVVAMAGIGTLSVLVDTDSLPSQGFQSWFFPAADIALTALILAGGSDGIHQILTRFNVFSSTAKPKT